MYRSLTFLLLLFTCSFAFAQSYPVDTIEYHGDVGKRINFVVMGDGFQASEMADFDTAAKDISDALFLEAPFNQYRNYFNVFTIQVSSTDSGADHPGTTTDVTEPAIPVVDVNTALGSSFDAFNIHRLLVPFQANSINSILAINTPYYDQNIVLVNSPHYGGSGGTNATSSLASSAKEIAIHEIGHSFVNLADEYYAGDIYANERINMTQQTDPNLVKWKNWMGDNGVGIYQHCCGGNSASWYRPHQNGKMRALGQPFCSVCIEGIIEEIHDRVSPIDNYSPVTLNIPSPTFPLDFRLGLIYPIPNTLSSRWELNGSTFQVNQDSISLLLSDLNPGTNQLAVFVTDTNSMLRVDNHATLHVSSVTWTIENPSVSVESVVRDYQLEVYPNPATSVLRVKMAAEPGQVLEVRLQDLQGKELLRVPAEPDVEQELDLSGFAQGIYSVSFYADGLRVGSQKVVRQ